MPTIPTAVRKFADSIPHPVALIGCRTSDLSLDCCEYDLAVFVSERRNNQFMQINDRAVELLYFAGPIIDYILELSCMTILKDTNKFVLSSAARYITPAKYAKALVAAGKKSLISSLFCQQKMQRAIHPAVAAMWLKIASYDFLDGTLAMTGNRPMPLHELEQLRQIDTGKMVEGVEVALECIGIERATRPAIARSIDGVKELKSNDHDRVLFESKVNHLLRHSKLADCYYYSGKVATKNLAGRGEPFYRKYTKLIQLTLDLSSDVQHLEKLQKRLFKATNGSLKG